MTAPGAAPEPPEVSAHHLKSEVRRLRDEGTEQQALAHRRASFWGRVDIILGFPAALLASVSGAAGLASADARVPAALMALASAGCAAGAAFLRSDNRRLGNKRARQAWAALEAKARVKLAYERVTPEDLDELFGYRQAALAAYEEEDAHSDPVPTPEP